MKHAAEQRSDVQAMSNAQRKQLQCDLRQRRGAMVPREDTPIASVVCHSGSTTDLGGEGLFLLAIFLTH